MKKIIFLKQQQHTHTHTHARLHTRASTHTHTYTTTHTHTTTLHTHTHTYTPSTRHTHTRTLPTLHEQAIRYPSDPPETGYGTLVLLLLRERIHPPGTLPTLPRMDTVPSRYLSDPSEPFENRDFSPQQQPSFLLSSSFLTHARDDHPRWWMPTNPDKTEYI